MGTLGPWGLQCWPFSWWLTVRVMFLGSLISSPDPPKSHHLPISLPRPPGDDRDRVHGERLSGRLPEGACPALPCPCPERGKFCLGVGRSCEASKTPRCLDPTALGRGKSGAEPYGLAPSWESLCAAQGPAARPQPTRGASAGRHGGCDGKRCTPSRCLAVHLLGALSHLLSPLSSAKWMNSPCHPTYLSGLL